MFLFFKMRKVRLFWVLLFFVSKVFSKQVFLGGICTFSTLFWWWENYGKVYKQLKIFTLGCFNVFVTLKINATNSILCYGSTNLWILCILQLVIFFFTLISWSIPILWQKEIHYILIFATLLSFNFCKTEYIYIYIY